MTYLTQYSSRHLTEEQLCELLSVPTDPASPTSTATSLHLRTCSDCQAELNGLRASLTNLRLATTALAAYPPGLTQRVTVVEQSSAWRRPAWAASFASAVLLLAVSVPFLHSGHGVVPAPGTTAVGSPVQTASANESDEALMDNIQRDLSTSIPPSLQPLAVPAASSASSNESLTQN